MPKTHLPIQDVWAQCKQNSLSAVLMLGWDPRLHEDIGESNFGMILVMSVERLRYIYHICPLHHPVPVRAHAPQEDPSRTPCCFLDVPIAMAARGLLSTHREILSSKLSLGCADQPSSWDEIVVIISS